MNQRVAYADFGVEDTQEDRETISQLLIHRRNHDDSMTYLGWYSRQAIINGIENGQTYMTIKINDDDSWSMGANIHVVQTRHGKYLRTDRNTISEDNLDYRTQR